MFRTQDPWTPTPDVIPTQIFFTLTSGSRISGPTQRREPKLCDTMGNDKEHHVLRFVTNPAVGPEVPETPYAGKRRLTGNRQFMQKE